jgi:HD-GYP domain-containing protein (c-di-GMP phosphodiesterase class II)
MAEPTPMAPAVRLAELVATLSLATDLGHGQPLQHTVRQTALAMRIANLVGADDDDRVATYYTSLLDSVYCHADAHEQALWFGDDIGLKADSYEADMESVRALLLVLRRLGTGDSGLDRVRRIASFPFGGWKTLNSFLITHSTLQSRFASAIGLPDPVSRSLVESYERWDGKGLPNKLAGAQIALAARIVNVADLAEVAYRTGGIDASIEVVRDRRGGQLDPDLADVFCGQAPALLEGLDGESVWADIITGEPGLARVVSSPELDPVLQAMADLVDMKSPHFAGHSRGVANLSTEAGRLCGKNDGDIKILRRAGLLHDLGRLGVSNAVWERSGPLDQAAGERVRLHAYLTDRMLAGVPALEIPRRVAARHHERLDGSGYPSGLYGSQLSPLDRLLASADAYHAMGEPRPHRDGLDADAAAAALRSEVKAGRLDGDAVDAVLRAAGHRVPARTTGPSGLTGRELEVLRLLARGTPNRAIAAALSVSPKTVSSHVEHIYTKLGVTSRATATLFAIEHGLVGSYEAPVMMDS